METIVMFTLIAIVTVLLIQLAMLILEVVFEMIGAALVALGWIVKVVGGGLILWLLLKTLTGI